MSKWNKEELENMLEDVVNELDLSEVAVEKHGQEGTAPSELVRIILEQKDLEIRALRANFVDVRNEQALNLPFVKNLLISFYTDIDSMDYEKIQIELKKIIDIIN